LESIHRTLGFIQQLQLDFKDSKQWSWTSERNWPLKNICL